MTMPNHVEDGCAEVTETESTNACETTILISTILPKKDFFVSYTEVDENIAEWIAYCLEDAGYKVTFQKWDFRPGNNFVLLMNKALYESEHLIAVLSPSYQEALFAAPEWAAIFSDDPQGFSRKLIPVRVKEFRPNGLLKAIVYIDLVPHLKNKDKETARTALLDGIREGRAKPKCEPIFPLYCEE
jgi:hypothetical protein